MTEPTYPTPQTERAERALRDALSRQAASAPADVALPTRPAGASRRLA